MQFLLHFAEGRNAAAFEEAAPLFADFIDPEGRFYWVRHLSQMGRLDQALSELQRAVAGGYFCAPSLATDPWLAPLRSQPQFEGIRREAEQRRQSALAAFRVSGGPKILGDIEPA
jgi:hypothetical protein